MVQFYFHSFFQRIENIIQIIFLLLNFLGLSFSQAYILGPLLVNSVSLLLIIFPDT